MAARARERATYDDLVKVPEHMVAEIIEGELYASPRPRPRHADVATALVAFLRSRFGRGGDPGGWHIVMEPELHLGEDVLVPDLAGWRLETMPAMPLQAAFFDIAPDWVCEVLSSSTARIDRVKKMPIYARNGVRHAWIVDPEQESLEVRRLENRRWMEVAIFSGADVIRAEPFDLVEIDLSLIWSVE